MRRCNLLLFLGLAALGACRENAYRGAALGPAYSYELSVAQAEVTVRQDDTVRVTASVTREGTVPLTTAQIEWWVDDLSIASVTKATAGLLGGLVTGKRGGQTVVHAAYGSDTADVTVTVTARPADFIDLTVNHTANDSGRIFGLPFGSAATAWLKAVVKSGGSGGETVYCNAIACAPFPGQTQRIVVFRSLEPTEATISNAVATAGQISALDTTGNRFIPFVLEVPADGIADTAWVRIALRVTDSITIRPDSFTVFESDGDDDRVAFSNIVARDSTIVLAVNRFSLRDSLSAAQTALNPFGRTATSITITGVAPRITWESANDNYAIIDAGGRVAGVRNTWLPADVPATAAACSPAIVRITATDATFNYDRVATSFPIPDSVIGPGAAGAPPRLLPAPWLTETGCTAAGTPPRLGRGVTCTRAQPPVTTPATPIPGDAVCTVVIRATITDPAGSPLDANNDGVPDNVKRFLFAVSVRNP